MNKGVFRALSLLSMVGFGMITPILIAVYLGGKFFPGNAFALIGIVLFGVAVAARNCYRLLIVELRRGGGTDSKMVGRPKGYEDLDDED